MIYHTPADDRYLRRKYGHQPAPDDLVECSDGTWRTRAEREEFEAQKTRLLLMNQYQTSGDQ